MRKVFFLFLVLIYVAVFAQDKPYDLKMSNKAVESVMAYVNEVNANINKLEKEERSCQNKTKNTSQDVLLYLDSTKEHIPKINAIYYRNGKKYIVDFYFEEGMEMCYYKQQTIETGKPPVIDEIYFDNAQDAQRYLVDGKKIRSQDKFYTQLLILTRQYKKIK